MPADVVVVVKNKVRAIKEEENLTIFCFHPLRNTLFSREL